MIWDADEDSSGIESLSEEIGLNNGFLNNGTVDLPRDQALASKRILASNCWMTMVTMLWFAAMHLLMLLVPISNPMNWMATLFLTTLHPSRSNGLWIMISV
jgi:hypothetical protein